MPYPGGYIPITSYNCWSADEDELLTSYMNNTPPALWSNRLGIVEGRSQHDCRARWEMRLMRRKPTQRETEKFATIYQGSADLLWVYLFRNCAFDRIGTSTPWANMGDDNASLIANRTYDWYKSFRHELWQSIAWEMEIPWGVVETMFFNLSEKERAEGVQVDAPTDIFN